jgi:inosine-uridine nucleoside N-ribohydrolase
MAAIMILISFIVVITITVMSGENIDNYLIIDNDGGGDDFISIVLQLLKRPNQIKAITIVASDCYGQPAYWVTEKLLKNTATE